MKRAILILATLLAAAMLAATASAATPDFVLRMPESTSEPGSGAGETDNPRGIAANPETGHVYVSDNENARIDEYTAWGAFVKAWGWDVAPDGAPGDTASDELEACTVTCKAGVKGNGAGQMNAPFGIAVDANGDIYLHESTANGEPSRRVQKFDPEGHFLLMFGGEVDKTTKANLCTKADLEGGDVCGAGVPGTGPGELSNGSVGNYLTYNPATDTIFVGDVDRIEEFNADGAFESQIPFEGELQAFDGRSVRALASDSTGNLYLALENTEDLYKLSAAGVPLEPGKPKESKFEMEKPLAVAVDGEGNVYAVDDPEGGFFPEQRVVEFDAATNKLVPTKGEEEAGEFFPYVPFHGPALSGLATNLCAGSEAPGNLYISFFLGGQVSYVNAYGTGPVGCEPPPPSPPVIATQYATSVSRGDATLKAQINPRFWQDATYYVQYGTGKCSEGGCEAKQPASAAKLTGKAVNAPVTTAGVFLTGLESATTYHYRFVAQSSGGGPTTGEEGAFRTFALPSPSPACPANEAFRTGPSAKLPDCRAYEMVSPLEKENGDAAGWVSRANQLQNLAELNQSAISGERFAYTSFAAFADPESAPFVSQYLAERTAEGWSSRSLSPPHTASPVEATLLFTNEFHGFSPDLCTAWVRHLSVAPLAEGAIEKYANVYRRDNCAAPGSYEALTTVQPSNRAAAKYLLRVQGFSADGSHTIFNANGKLQADAPALTETELVLLYEHTPEGLRFVCYLPSGKPVTQGCVAGTEGGSGAGQQSSVHNAISADGRRIFWSAGGQIYVRVDGSETLKVSGSASPEPATYWTAAADGSKAIFAFSGGPLKEQLYEFDLESKTAQLIAKGVQGPMGASEDASRIYFASSEDLDGGGPASKGGHNLYLYEVGEGEEEGTFTFVMALAAQDVFGTDREPAPIDETPAQRSARISPDGLHAAFASAASPAPGGYDNTDTTSGEPDEEVYLYDATQDKLRCVSCNPTGARPAGENIGPFDSPHWATARIQGWEALLHAPHVLSDDGSRVYFESHEALVPRDTNGAWDVYQWEETGAGSCTQADATFSEAAEGCIELISSGQSPANSTFLDADPEGKNVFIGTQSSLVPADYGLNDVYDARIGGGFPEPQPPAACEGEACQGPLSAPNDPTPASSAFQGAGNVTEGAKVSCRKPKVARRGRCVARHRKRAKQANHKRRATR